MRVWNDGLVPEIVHVARQWSSVIAPTADENWAPLAVAAVKVMRSVADVKLAG